MSAGRSSLFGHPPPADSSCKRRIPRHTNGAPGAGAIVFSMATMGVFLTAAINSNP